MISQEAEIYMRDFLGHVYPVERYLRDVSVGQASSAIVALWNVRLLQDKLRHAEYFGLAGICAELEDSLMGLQCKANSREIALDLMEKTSILRQGPLSAWYRDDSATYFDSIRPLQSSLAGNA